MSATLAEISMKFREVHSLHGPQNLLKIKNKLRTS